MTWLEDDSIPSDQRPKSHLQSNSATWPQKRVELLGWFQSDAKPLADAYEGAVHLLNEPGFPGRVHFIAHAVRDIADRLIFVLDPQLKGSRVQYDNELDKIVKDWPKLEVFNDTFVLDQPDSIEINYVVASRINSLVKAHLERRERPSNYELLFRFLVRNEPSRGDVNKRLVSDFKKMRKWFMDLTHLRASGVLEIDERELQTQFNSFEGMLHSFVGDFFTGTSELDEILQQANG